MANLRCIACNITKSNQVESTLSGDALDMFNFVCCLDITQVFFIENCENNFVENKNFSIAIIKARGVTRTL